MRLAPAPARSLVLVLLAAALAAACGGGDAPADPCADVVCAAIDACHGVGVCDPATGACTAPALDDGAACDDGSAATPTDVCVAGACRGLPFTADQGWGPAGTPLPAGAEEVSLAEMADLAGQDGFVIVTADGRAGAVAATAQTAADARALVDAMMGADPRLPRWFPPAGTPLPADLTALPGGGYTTPDPDGGVFVLDGQREAALDLAFSLTQTDARANLAARYAALHAVLPGDEQAGLPAPADLAGVDDAGLRALVRDVEQRVERAVPPQQRLAEERDPGDLGCELPRQGLSFDTSNPGWELRAHETAIRSQGSRGTCVSFAIAAGLELAVARERGVVTDLSEQQLFAQAKGFWFPVPQDFGDGLPAPQTLEEMVDRNYRISAEARWPYNRSRQRLEFPLIPEYRQSCRGYDSYCSETNHQYRVVCTTLAGQYMCAFLEPPALATATVGRVRPKAVVSLWNPLEPENSLAAIRAMLRAGHPVVIGAAVDRNFRYGFNEATDEASGFVYTPGLGAPEEPTPGHHAMLVVGNLWLSQLPFGYGGIAQWDGPGFLVVKNSWGCRGDGGHGYLSYAWAIDNIQSATAIVDIGTDIETPTVTLWTSRSKLTTAGTARLAITSNRAVTRVQLFDGLAATTPIFERAIAAPADGTQSTFDRAFTSADNGMHLFFVRGEDSFGNVVESAIVGVLVAIDDVAPTVTLTVNPTAVQAPGTFYLTATAADPSGIAKVQFLRGLSVIGVDTTPPYALAVPVTLADAGQPIFAAIAFDGAGNQQVSNLVTATVVGSGIRPLVPTFTATPMGLPFGGGVVVLTWQTLGATTVRIDPSSGPAIGPVAASGSRMVPITTSTTFTLTAHNAVGDTVATAGAVVAGPAAPAITSFTATPSLLPAGGGAATLAWTLTGDVTAVAIDHGVGDVGALAAVGVTVAATTTFTLTATGPAGTATRTVTIDVATTPTTYVSPTGSDAGNLTCAAATPCQTIAHAAAQAGAGGVVILQDGTYDTTTQGNGDVAIPAGITLTADHDRLAVVKNRLTFAGGGAVIGVRIDRTAPSARPNAGLWATGGALLIESVDWKGSFGGASTSAGLEASGAAVVTVRPGAVADYTAETVALGSVSWQTPFLYVRDDAQVTVEGGRFGGPGLGAPASTVSNGAGAALLLRNRGRLTLRGATVVFNACGAAVLESGQLHLEAGAQLVAGAASGGSTVGLQLERNVAGETPRAFLTDATIDGAAGTSHVAACVLTTEAGTSGELTLRRATLRGCVAGVRTSAGTGLALVGTDSVVRDNVAGGFDCQGACDVALTGGAITANALGATGSRGGVWMGAPTVTYRLRLRGVAVTGNQATTNSIDNSGLYLRGNASSVFDLGTAADPGGNLFRDNVAGSASANVALNLAAGVVVQAVGNTWNPGLQGADASGALAVGTVTSGAGANYRIVAGTLVTSP